MNGVVDPAIHVTLRIGLALLFLHAALHKLRHRSEFRAALAGYSLLPGRLLGVTAASLPFLEIAVATALILFPSQPHGAVAAVCLLGVYSAAIGINLGRGRREIDCGCGGPAGKQRLSGPLLVRNFALIVAALAAAGPAGGRAWYWVDTISVLGGVSGFALLYAAFEQGLANSPRRGHPAHA